MSVVPLTSHYTHMKRQVLVVDDSNLNIQIITKALSDEGYEVYPLLDGTKVVEVVQRIRPDAVLLDIVMPEIDGFEVCSLLKSKEETRSIPIIMVTAISEADLLKKAFELGAFDYIKKPFDKIEIIARLNSALRFHDQQKKLESLAMKDGLTNLYNHRLIMELLEKECIKAMEGQHSISFLMFDIDFFKKVNDTYGHKTGDFILKNFAHILQDTVSANDLVGRYGGEEFCIIVPNKTMDSVLLLSERLRAAVDHHKFLTESSCSLHITTSIGVVYHIPMQEINPNNLITIADKKLYEAKHNGRNRVEYQIIRNNTMNS